MIEIKPEYYTSHNIIGINDILKKKNINDAIHL